MRVIGIPNIISTLPFIILTQEESHNESDNDSSFIPKKRLIPFVILTQEESHNESNKKQKKEQLMRFLLRRNDTKTYILLTKKHHPFCHSDAGRIT